MNRLNPLFLLVSVLVLTSYNGPLNIEGKVYVCMGKYSTRYPYNPKCRGLSNCSTKIHETTWAKAKEMDRTLCGWED